MNREELNTQIAVVNYVTMQYPKVLFCASAGGLRTTPSQAKNMKLSGYKKGFLDLFFYEPRGNFHGLALELKRLKGGRYSAEQKRWIKELNERGYLATGAAGFDQAKLIIDDYLKRI